MWKQPKLLTRHMLAIGAMCLCALMLMWRPVLRGEVFLPIDALLHSTLLFLVIPLAQAFGYYAFFHVILAGLGAYVFARQLRLGDWPSLVAGLSYMLSGHLMTWLYFPRHTGEPAQLYRANYALRGVWLPAGERLVQFEYRPRAFFAGGLVSLTTLLALVGAWTWHWWRRAGRTWFNRKS